MGMTIEEKFKVLTDEYAHLNGKYAMIQVDYENRLKADLVAMLEELKKEVEENLEDNYSELDEIQGALRAGRLIENVGCAEIIQQKINALKGE